MSASSSDAMGNGAGGLGFNGDVALFAGWKQQMEAVLDYHGLLDVVEAQIKHSGYAASSVVDASDGGPVLSAEERAKLPKASAEEIQKGKKAFMLIKTAIKSHTVLSLVADVPRGNAYGLWRCLTAHYSRETAANKNHLLQVYHALRQGSGESAAMYIARTKQAVASLSAVGEAVTHTSMLSTFSGGLLPEYSQLRIILPMLGKEMRFEEVCSMVLSTEAQIVSDKRASSSSYGSGGGRQVEQAHSVQQQKRRDGSGVVCWKCNKTGHTKRECGGADVRKCTHCLRVGHVVEQCYDKQKGVPAAPSARSVSAMVSETVFESLMCVEVMQVVGEPTWAQVASGTSRGASKPWKVDSGSSRHCAEVSVAVQDAVVNETIQIRVASGEVLAAPSVGTLVLETTSGQKIGLKGVMSHPKLCANLLSVSSLCSGTNGGGMWFTEKKAQVINAETASKIQAIIRESSSSVLLEAEGRRGLYEFDATTVEHAHSAVVEVPTAVVPPVPAASVGVMSEEAKRWHYRLAHMSPSGIKKLKDSGAVVGLEDVPLCPDGELCAACMRGKAHRAPFGVKTPERARATRVLERVHADLCGPITASLGGSAYMLLIVDEFSRKVFGFFITRKSDAAALIMQWCRRAVAETGKAIVEFHTDGGGEFTSSELGAFYVENGIKATTTQPHTPQQNGIVERANRYIMESVRSMLAHAGASKLLWAEFAMAAIHIRNRSVVRKDTGSTSEALWSGASAKPSVAALRVLGCDAWIHVPDVHRTKLEDKSRLGVFIGYNEKTLGYRVMDARTRVVCASRDVRFEEDKFSQCAEMVRSLGEDNTDFEFDLNAAMHNNEMRLVLMISKDEDEKQNKMQEQAVGAADAHVGDGLIPAVIADASIVVGEENGAAVRRVSTRAKFKVNRLGMVEDGDIGGDAEAMAVEASSARADTEEESAFQMVVKAASEFPSSYEEAIASSEKEEWLGAIGRELSSLDSHNTFTIVPLPAGKRALGTRWVFRTKVDAEGKVIKHKARLVVQGFAQRRGIDYNETFAPVLAYDTLRVLLAIVAELDYELLQMDVPTAFLNATMKEELYIKVPAGYGGKFKIGDVGRLNKSLYGLVQAPYEWHAEFNGAIVARGYTRCQSDSCVYVKLSLTGRMMILPIFVDDVFPMCAPCDLPEFMIDVRALMVQYQIRDVANADVVLGMRVVRDRARRTLSIDQKVYVQKLLTAYNMLDCNSAATPECDQRDAHPSAAATVQSEAEDARIGSSIQTYGSIVGALLYIALSTRPDIAHAVAMLSRALSNPRLIDWIACKRALRYLKGTAELGLVFGGSNMTDAVYEQVYKLPRAAASARAGMPAIVLGPSYCDASYAGDAVDRKSTTGLVIKVCGSLVCWSSKKQAIITLSSAEAEYIAAGSAVQKLVWVRALLGEVGFQQRSASLLLCDNQSAIAIANDSVQVTRTKHIDVRHHSIREQIGIDAVRLSWVPTADQQADILTKALGRVSFERMRAALVGTLSEHGPIGPHH